MTKPQGFRDSAKWYLWHYIVTPVFPKIRNTLVKLRIVKHAYRQNWHIGWLAPGRSLEAFKDYLHTQGFGNHFIAWVDSDEVLSFRKLDGFSYQYHLRVFKDNEIRGHYEKTPEAHPIQHFNEDTFEPRTEAFKKWLGDWVVDQEKPIATASPQHLAAVQTTDSGEDQYTAKHYTQ